MAAHGAARRLFARVRGWVEQKPMGSAKNAKVAKEPQSGWNRATRAKNPAGGSAVTNEPNATTNLIRVLCCFASFAYFCFFDDTSLRRGWIAQNCSGNIANALSSNDSSTRKSRSTTGNSCRKKNRQVCSLPR